jgi:hypothetical protein
MSNKASIGVDLEGCGVFTTGENIQGNTNLIQIVAMLTKLGQRNREVRENSGRYDRLDYDNDNDSDYI